MVERPSVDSLAGLDPLVPARLLAPALDRVEQKIGVVDGRLHVPMRPDRLDRPVGHARKPEQRRIVAHEPELVVRGPRRLVEHRAGARRRATASSASSGSRPERPRALRALRAGAARGSRRRRARGSSRGCRARAPSRPAGRPDPRTGYRTTSSASATSGASSSGSTLSSTATTISAATGRRRPSWSATRLLGPRVMQQTESDAARAHAIRLRLPRGRRRG